MAATTALALGFSGCNSDTSDGIEGTTCVSNDEYFAVLFFEDMKETCGSCHIGGIGYQQSDFKMVPPSEAGFLDTNLAAVKKVAEYEADGQSVFLQKPLGKLEHGGGTIFDSEDDPRYQKFVELVDRIKNGDTCPNTEAQFLSGVNMAGEQETLRKAALTLAARLPTQEEIDAVDAGGWDAVYAVIDNYMKEEAFYERLKEKYNDLLLTDFYLNGDFDVIGDNDMYDPRWYEAIDTNDPALLKKYGARDGEDLMNKLEWWTTYGVARESIELIAYTVKNNLPFTNVVTADYMVVNPFSAKAFKIPDAEFTNDADPAEFVPARLGGYDSDFPHAGVMTDPIWLQRHPTTDTNRNRHRAKEILYVFLGNDILKAAERPIAINEDALADNPTVNNDNCTVCHNTVDRVAGWWRNFQPMDDEAQFQYNPDADWFPEMFQTGFNGVDMPPSSYDKGTKWAGQQVANNPGFAFAATFVAYRMLTGNEPLQPPQQGSPNFQAELTAFLGQYYTFSKVSEAFRNGGYNFKQLVKDLIASPYFRAINTAPDIAESQLGHLTAVGTGHFLTPEQLNRKIETVLGIHWGPAYEDYDSTPNLLNGSEYGGEAYRILFGGIDSRNTTTRITSPSGIMANVAERMGLEVGCRLSNAEFSIPKEQRKFLKNVELTDEPQDPNFRDVPESIALIKKDIAYLHQVLLGEKVDESSEEVERTYQLFVDVWQDGKTNVIPVDTSFPWECISGRNYVTGQYIPEEMQVSDDSLYTGRAWQAVLAYILTDYTFLYE